MSELVQMIGASFLAVFILMSLLWTLYYLKQKSSIVDLGWLMSFMLIMWICLLIGDGWPPRKWLLAFMVWIWAGRLCWHLYLRLSAEGDDPRYVCIKERWGAEYINFKFYLMFLFQGLLAIILSLPFMIVCLDTYHDWNIFEGWAVVVWLIGVAGEAIADNQLASFKADPANAGKVCQNGLWYYSRHPNYFFEFVVWVSFFLFALGNGWGIFAIVSPALMLFLLLKVSGVPPTEEQALKTKPLEYREYQRTTSEFVPWFKKS